MTDTDRLPTVLRDTALKYQELAAKMEPGPSRAAAQIVGNALLDVWHALMTTQAEGTPEPAPKPAECHEVPFDGACECTLPAHHADPLHSDAYGNRWSW